MFIAILDATFAAADRAAVLGHFDTESAAVRSMPGNVAFRVYAARADDTTVTVVHEWADEESFAGYLESASFARLGASIRPLMTGTPVSRRFHAEPVGS